MRNLPIPSMRLASTAALAVLLAACGGAREDTPAFAARDSAGVRVAESARPFWPEGQGWTVDETPRLEIPVGREGGDAVLRLPDGRVAVPVRGRIRLYAPNGALADSLLLPNEFGVFWLGMAGDSLLGWTYRKELLVYGPDGRLARQVPVSRLYYLSPAVLGRLADGTLLVTEGSRDNVDATLPRRELVRHVLVGPDGGWRGVFGDLPEAARMKGMEVPFSPRTVVAVRDGDVLVGDNRSFEFAVHAPDGAVRAIVRRAHTPLAVEPADVETWHVRHEPLITEVPRSLRPVAEERRRARRAVAPADTFPAYERLLAGPTGEVWAEEARRPAEYHARWSVFDREGRWLGTVRMPSGFVLRQVGPDWVLGTEPNVRGHTVVRLYPLARTPAERPAAP
jgi:hypothetical protein